MSTNRGIPFDAPSNGSTSTSTHQTPSNNRFNPALNNNNSQQHAMTANAIRIQDEKIKVLEKKLDKALRELEVVKFNKPTHAQIKDAQLSVSVTL